MCDYILFDLKMIFISWLSGIIILISNNNKNFGDTFPNLIQNSKAGKIRTIGFSKTRNRFFCFCHALQNCLKLKPEQHETRIVAKYAYTIL